MKESVELISETCIYSDLQEQLSILEQFHNKMPHKNIIHVAQQFPTENDPIN